MIDVGEWAFFSFTYDGSDLKIYKNGAFVKRWAATGRIASTTDPITIGENHLPPEGSPPVVLDELMIFNRALSLGEIKGMMILKSLHLDMDSLISTGNLQDLSGHGNHGKLMSGSFNPQQGIRGSWFGTMDLTGNILVDSIYSKVDFSDYNPGGRADYYSVRLVGWLYVPSGDQYTFYLTTDDGARLWIDENLTIDEWLGSTVIEDLLPRGFDDVTGATFTVAQFLFAYELAQRPLKPIKGVETALKHSIVALMLLGVSTAVEVLAGNTREGLIFLVLLDVAAMYIALSGLRDMLTISGRGANFVRMWYPFLYPVTVAMNAIGIATTATELVTDAGRLKGAIG